MTVEQSDSDTLTRWETESLRLTAFVTEGTTIDGNRRWWAETVGYEPDEILARPSVGQYQQVGDFHGQRLVWATKGDRIDLQLVFNPSQMEAFEDRLLTIGFFEELIDPFREVARQLLAISPPIVRLAFGGVLILPVPGVDAGYSDINRRVPYVRIPEGSSDFRFQINIPQDSTIGIESMRINRLTKWSVMRAEVLGIVFRAGSPTTSSGRPIGYGERLEIDINTQENVREIPSDKVSDVFNELVDLGIEISRNGI